MMLAAWAADPYAESARAKIAMIREDQAPAGAVIPISAQEWNAWIRAELAGEPELGLREPKVTLGDGQVTFEVLADFGKLARGANGVFARLLEGERTVKLVARPETAAGQVTVRLELLEINGVALSGVLLNAAAELVMAAVFDGVRVNQPFAMGHNIDRAAIEPGLVRVFIAAPPAATPRER
jgi:hypothetical protein